MRRRYAMEYWKDGDWFVGKLREVRGVFSQGETLEELEENIREAFQLMTAGTNSDPVPAGAQVKDVEIEV